MNPQVLFRSLFVLTVLLGAASATFSQQSPPESDKAKEIVALVEKAAALIDAKGKAAFPEFKKKGSEWRTGDTYLFANDMKSIQLLNAASPEREGTDQSSTKDANGKLITAELIKAAQSSAGGGWVNYMWPKPGQTRPSQKWSYVKAVQVDGTPALVGAGFYPE